jgi:tripartite-type tricarboxylate transporter receptor subunit TctC
MANSVRPNEERIVRDKRHFGALLACTLIGLLSLRAMSGESYPNRPVTIIVPFARGGYTDILGRYAAAVLQRALHRSFVVENRPGDDGAIGIGYAAKSAADGYTLLHASTALVVLPHLMKSVSYDATADFDPIVLIGLAHYALVVAPSLNVNSVQDLMTLAKAKPGVLTYASVGIGRPHQLFAELFKSMANVDIRPVSYKSVPTGTLDVASGKVSMMFVDLAPPPRGPPLFRKMKILAVTSGTRDKDVPDIPTIAETLPGYEANYWLGMLSPAGTPKAAVDKINDALVADLKQSETAEHFKSIGIEVRWSTPEEFRTFIRAESEKWTKVLRAAGIEPQ